MRQTRQLSKLTTRAVLQDVRCMVHPAARARLGTRCLVRCTAPDMSVTHAVGNCWLHDCGWGYPDMLFVQDRQGRWFTAALPYMP